MNHIYRSIWNESTGTVTAVCEHARRGGKKTSSGKNAVVSSGFTLKSVSVAVALALGSNSHAAPTGGTVVAGNASITSAPGNTTINQSSQNTVLNWQSFDVGVTEAVRFVQPNSNSVALNRVLGADPSSILGSLSANGKVFLINPNGVLFGTGAQVNVGALVASTRNITDSDFLAGRYTFSGDSNGSILNQGAINADGGYVALLGANVSNQGVIAAKLGSVALAAGNALTLDVAGDGLLNVTVNAGAVDALVHNGGLIQADGGQVLLTAQSASSLLQSAVNNTGVIQAQTIENRDGVIKLLGDMQGGTVNVGGTLDASAPNGGNGGFIDTSAAHVKVAGDTRVTTAAAQGLTGSWLIDPTDYTIAASGGDITGALLSANLASTDIIIQSISGAAGTNGDVNVNDTVTWSANRLTLNAQNDINVNTAMNASGTASLALEYGQGAIAAGNTSTVNVNAPVNLPAGNNFSTLLGSDGVINNYTVITSLGAEGSATGSDLQGMNGNLNANYVLGSNIDATVTTTWDAGAGFAPIMGSVSTTYVYEWGSYVSTTPIPFTGVFDGLGHTISSLTINRPATDKIGLFGFTESGSLIRNVGLVSNSMTGNGNIGGLVGDNSAAISNSYATGSVMGSGQNIGGLTGSNSASISNSYATGSVTGTGEHMGGLVGFNTADISNSHATGGVAGANWIGGLVGYSTGTLSSSYATGTVDGNQLIGGLVGNNQGPVSNSYATGDVNGFTYVGGLLGFNSGTVIYTYAAGSVLGSNTFGGLVGSMNDNTVSDSYWNSTLNASGMGRGTTAGVAGLTAVEMQTAANFAGFNFTATPGASGNNWVMVDADGSLNNTGGTPSATAAMMAGATRPMLASEYSTTIGNAHQLQLMSMAPAASYTLGQNIDAAATGTANDVWSGSSFIPVGVAPDMDMDGGAPFSGTLDGLGHAINSLTINLPTTANVGLFSIVSGGTVRNVGLTGGSVTGQQYVGALIGRNENGTVTNSYATAAVAGTGNRVGGLIGNNQQGTISGSYATGTVSGAAVIGGLTGGNASGTISNSYATGAVTGTEYIGGLVGANEAGTISNSYATGAATGSGDNVGGLAGYIFGSQITNNYATGAVSGTGNVGGLVGMRDEHGAGPSFVSNNYWNSDVYATGIGFDITTGATGLTSEQMKSAANFASWDFSTTWVGYDGLTNPLLRTFMTPLTVTVNDVTKSYDGQAYSASATYSLTPDMSNLSGSLSFTGGTDVNVGTYGVTASGLYSNQSGYIISYVDGTLTIDPHMVNLSASRTYDGTSSLSAGIFNLSTLPNGETLTLSGSGTVTSANAGTGKVVTLGTLVLGDGSGLASNYTFTGGTHTADITQAILTVTVAALDKIYDGTTIAGTTLTLGGLIGSETIGISGVAAFNSKDVVDANLVTVNSITLSNGTNGGLASNYSLASSSGQTAPANITPKALTVVDQAAMGKEYDGTTIATLSGGALIGVIAGETVMLSEAGTFATANVGSDIAVTAANSLGGTAAVNYTVTQPIGLSASITAPVVPENPPVSPENPPVNIISTAGYQSAVGHVSASAQVTPAGVSSPLPSISSNSSLGGQVSYDFADLNLTVIAQDANSVPGMKSEDTADDTE